MEPRSTNNKAVGDFLSKCFGRTLLLGLVASWITGTHQTIAAQAFIHRAPHKLGVSDPAAPIPMEVEDGPQDP